MRKLLLLLTIFSSLSTWAQKEYSISNRNPVGWAPLSSGEVDIHAVFSNNATNAADTFFTVEFLDATIPSTWGLSFCTDLVCYPITIGTPLKADFYTPKGKSTDFKCTMAFASASGSGFARFIVYRANMMGQADTIVFNGSAPATGVKATATKALEVSISPNPVRNELQVTLSDLNITSASIVNLVGKEVMQIDVKSGRSFDVSNLPNGIYFLSLKKGDRTLNKKFVISR
jgi:hypothetical protein